MPRTERFPPSPLTGLIDEIPRYNLGSSYAPDLTWSDLMELGASEYLDGLVIGYGTSRGGERLRTAIARSIGVEPDDVIVTVGASGALFLTSFVLAGPGDEVVTVSPNFPPTVEAVAASGATLRRVPLSFDDRYRLSLDQLAAALTERTTLVVLVSPGNPSGVSMPQSEVAEALRIIRARAPRAEILVDETFRRGTYGDAVPLPSTASWDARVLTTESLSKAHGVPGLRLGWLVCRDAGLRARIGAAKMGTVISCGAMDEALATLVIDREREILASRRRLLDQAVRRVEAWVAENAAYVEWVRPDAGALCTVRLRADRFAAADVQKVYDAFKARGVMVAPAAIFGDEERIFRLGFGAVDDASLGEALAAMREALTALAR